MNVGAAATGTGLVLLTWTVLVAVTIALGLLPALACRHPSGPMRATEPGHAPIWRAAIWWGLLTLVALVLVLSALRVPLAGPVATGTVAALAVLLGGLGLWRLRGRGPATRRRAPRAVVVLLTALGLATAYLALKAIGPITHYDSGLYHLGVIAYAADFGTVPGLANLHRPFGYANALFPLGAFLGGGPWDGIGYRLLNGFVLVLAMLELVLRLLGSRRHRWGTWVLVIGLGATLPALVAMADFWVTSPNPDATMLVLTLVASAYLADLVETRRAEMRSLNGSVVIALVVVMLAIRPTAAFFAATTFAVVFAIHLRWRRLGQAGVSMRTWTLSGVAAVVVGGLVVARDVLLSGWIGYPLSFVHVDVPWIAYDPTGLREGTLAAARDPYTTDSWHTAHSWDWVGGWIGRLPQQWEPWLLLALIVIGAGLWFLAPRALPTSTKRLTPTLRQVLIVALPSLVAIAAWFTVSPPSFRFAWGPVFSAPVIVIAASMVRFDRRRADLRGLWRSIDGTVVVIAAFGVLAITVFSLVFRSQASEITEARTWQLGPITIDYAVAPLPTVMVHEGELPSGLVVVTPDDGELCWGVYPLCTPLVGDIEQCGPSIGDGFAIRE